MDRQTMREMTCCFTGHRFLPAGELQDIGIWVEQTIRELHRRYGVRFFGAGGALGFDTLAAEKVLQVSERFPDIKLIIVAPCRGQEARWRPKDQERYRSILQSAAKVVYLSEQYYDGCMLDRNRHLVDGSKWCVAYQTKATGGTAYTVEYAQKCGLELVNYPKKIFL